MTYRGHVKGGVVLLDPLADLPDGTEVTVQPVAEKPRGSADAIDDGAGAFWSSGTISELSNRQKVIAPRSMDDLAGDWPEGESLDEFLNQIRRDRD